MSSILLSITRHCYDFIDINLTSAFVGLAVIIALLPVPGYVASCIHKVEIIGMGKTDGRVQDVTESKLNLSFYAIPISYLHFLARSP